MRALASLLVFSTFLTLGCADDGSSAGGAGGSGASGGSGGSGASGGTGGSGAQGGAGGAGASGGGGGDAGDFVAMCAYRAENCGTDEATCLSQEECARAFLSDAIEGSLIDCLSASCGEDACIAATEQTPPSTFGQTFFDDCQAKIDDCKGLITSDDICYAGYYVSDGALEPFAECLTLGNCADIPDCFDMVTATTFETCEDWI